MRSGPANGPEDRLRRTLELRGRPLKLNVGRLFKEFASEAGAPAAGDAIQTRLAEVGVRTRPLLRDVGSDKMIALELGELDLSTAPEAASGDVSADAPREHAPGPPSAPDPLAAPQPHVRPSPPAGAPAKPEGTAAQEHETSLFVRAAVDAERRVRDGHVRARDGAAERIAVLERELTTEREATVRARDERDELERGIHTERREAAARLQALASAERAARSLLEAQRTKLTNLTHAVRVCTAAIEQAREMIDHVHGQTRQTVIEIRETLAVDEADPLPAESPSTD